jgi:hypothetical protein
MRTTLSAMQKRVLSRALRRHDRRLMKTDDVPARVWCSLVTRMEQRGLVQRPSGPEAFVSADGEAMLRRRLELDARPKWPWPNVRRRA